MLPVGRPALCPIEAKEAIPTGALGFQVCPGALKLQLSPNGGPEALQMLDPILGPLRVPDPLGQFLAQGGDRRRCRLGPPVGRCQLRFELTDALECPDPESDLQAGGTAPAVGGLTFGVRVADPGSAHGGEYAPGSLP